MKLNHGSQLGRSGRIGSWKAGQCKNLGELSEQKPPSDLSCPHSAMQKGDISSHIDLFFRSDVAFGVALNCGSFLDLGIFRSVGDGLSFPGEPPRGLTEPDETPAERMES